METARQIAERFVGEASNVDDLERAILRHMEHHIVAHREAEREACAEIANAQPCPHGDVEDHTSCGEIIAEAIRARE